jgi:hypothetical protein
MRFQVRADVLASAFSLFLQGSRAAENKKAASVRRDYFKRGNKPPFKAQAAFFNMQACLNY